MPLDDKAKESLKKLLEMSRQNFDEMLGLLTELASESKLKINDSEEFRRGYFFGKIEHKFIDWFYSYYGRSPTDEEYIEFLDIVNKDLEKQK